MREDTYVSDTRHKTYFSSIIVLRFHLIGYFKDSLAVVLSYLLAFRQVVDLSNSFPNDSFILVVIKIRWSIEVHQRLPGLNDPYHDKECSDCLQEPTSTVGDANGAKDEQAITVFKVTTCFCG